MHPFSPLRLYWHQKCAQAHHMYLYQMLIYILVMVPVDGCVQFLLRRHTQTQMEEDFWCFSMLSKGIKGNSTRNYILTNVCTTNIVQMLVRYKDLHTPDACIHSHKPYVSKLLEHGSVEMHLCNEAESLLRTLQGRHLILSLPRAASVTHTHLHTPFNLNITQVEWSRGRGERGRRNM